MQEDFLQIHHFLAVSQANGPGSRAVLWLQGCHLKCPGCINPDTHNPESGKRINIKDIIKKLSHPMQTIEGVTISGGEPLEQIAPLTKLLIEIRQTTNYSILVFTGFTLTEINEMPLGPSFLKTVDVLITGRYKENLPSEQPLLASSNQKMHFLTNRYAKRDFENLPRAEIQIDETGVVELTGLAALTFES